MKLNAPQVTEFHRILGKHFPLSKLDILVGSIGRQREHYALGNDLRDIIARLVKAANDEGWIKELLEGARAVNPHTDIQTFVADALATLNQQVWYKPRNYYMTCFLPGNRAFIGRRDLRRMLDDLNNMQHSVLIIDGPPRSGKTYSLQLISYLANELQGYKVVQIDLKRDALVKYGPGNLVKSIARQMKLPVDTIPPWDPKESEEQWVQDLRDWLTGEVNQLGDTWWVIIDGFRHAASLPTTTLDLIHHLVYWTDSVMPPPFRIVLLDYPDVLPGEEGSNIKREKITRISDVDLKEFFKQLLQDKNIEPSPNVIDEAVNQVKSRVLVATDSPERLPQLARAVKEVSEQLFS